MTDLIDQVKELRDRQWRHDNYLSPADMDLMDDIIAALTPVLPDDVAAMRDFLLQSATQRAVDNLPASAEAHKQAADMLERLQRQNGIFLSARNEYFVETKELRQRIAELEAELEQVVKSATEIILDNAPEAMPALAVARGEARRMSEQPK